MPLLFEGLLVVGVVGVWPINEYKYVGLLSQCGLCQLDRPTHAIVTGTSDFGIVVIIKVPPGK